MLPLSTLPPAILGSRNPVDLILSPPPPAADPERLDHPVALTLAPPPSMSKGGVSVLVTRCPP